MKMASHLHVQTAGLIAHQRHKEEIMAGQEHSEDQEWPQGMATGADELAVVWWKSSYSNHESACVEMARIGQETIAFRDSKNPSGAFLIFPRSEVLAFVAGAARGEIAGR